MELSNINQPSQLDSTFDDSSFHLPTNSNLNNTNSMINTTFRPPSANEFSEELEQDVEYKPSQDIVQEKTQAISAQEEQRLQKLQQKELLINIQKNSNNQGSTYSRNMDEAIVMNTKQKDFGVKTNENNNNSKIQEDDILEGKIYIDPAAEEFFEEFLHPQKNKNNTEQESALKNFENNKKQQNNDNQKKKHNLYEFEDDEIINKDLLKIPQQNIQTINRNIQKKENQNINQNKQNINPALQKALKKDQQKNNINKLRQKFNKK